MIRKSSVFIMASMVIMFIASFEQSFAQIPVWKNYSCMYNINGITLSGGNIWAATSGGVFSYSATAGTFKQFTTTEGLSNIQATSIISDSGNLFIGEGDGTVDELSSSGEPLRSQTDIRKSSFLSKQVTDLVLSGDTLFACTPFGVTLISENSFVVLDSYLHFVPGQVTAQANSIATFAGNIYVASRFGLSVALRSAENLSAPDLWQMSNSSTFSSGVNALEVFNGYLVVGAAQGLYYSGDGTTFLQVPGPDSVISLSLTGNSILVNSKNGLARLNSDYSITPIPDNGTPLQCTLKYSDSLIVAGTPRGLLLIGSTIQTVLPPGPATNIINSISVDNAGNLWCSTSSDADRFNFGVAYMKFDGTTWHNFSKAQDPALPTNSYFEISAVCGGKVVAGSWGSGMALLNDSGSVENIFNSSNSSLVSDIGSPGSILVGKAACDPSGNIWIVNKSAYNGDILAVYSPGAATSWHSFYNGLSAPSGFIPIAIDGYGGVWTGDQLGDGKNDYSGVFYYNDNGTLANPGDDQSILLSTNDGLLNPQVNSLVVDNENQVWIGTAGGLNVVYDPSTPTDIRSIYSMLDQDILGIDYDALDHKWVSTNNGVYVLSNDGNDSLGEYDMTNSPLPSNNVTSVACDRIHGIVYFVTNYGITQLKMGVIQPQTNFAKIKVFPNPVKLPVKQVQIVGLVAQSQIKIFSISGKMVRSFQAQGGNIAYWDGKDSNGNLLPSGIYIIIAYSPDGSQSAVTKVAVIR